MLMQSAFRLLLVFSSITLTSCAGIANLFSTPTYFSHSADKIQFSNNSGTGNVFIKQQQNDTYGIYDNVIKDVKMKLKNNNINIVNNINQADYVLSINIKNVAIDVDYNFANKMKNALLANDVGHPYVFDNNNSPHANNEIIKSFDNQNKIRSFNRFIPSTLYTLLGSGIGFAGGFILAGSTAPFAFAVGGGVVVGGLTYILYNKFRTAGVVVSYEIIIDEKMATSINHNRKTIIKKSSNSSDETFYTYSNRWNTLTSKNIAIALGSRALMKQMTNNICPIIANSIVDIFSTPTQIEKL